VGGLVVELLVEVVEVEPGVLGFGRLGLGR
jgi:hypothetical protein